MYDSELSTNIFESKLTYYLNSQIIFCYTIIGRGEKKFKKKNKTMICVEIHPNFTHIFVHKFQNSDRKIKITINFNFNSRKLLCCISFIEANVIVKFTRL